MKLNLKAILVPIVVVVSASVGLGSQVSKAKYVGQAHMTSNIGEDANCSVEVQIESTDSSIKISRHTKKCEQRILSKKPLKIEFQLQNNNVLYKTVVIGTLKNGVLKVRASVSEDYDYQLDITNLGSASIEYNEYAWDKALIAPFVDASVEGTLNLKN